MIWWVVSVVQYETDLTRGFLPFELRLGLFVFDATSHLHLAGYILRHFDKCCLQLRSYELSCLLLGQIPCREDQEPSISFLYNGNRYLWKDRVARKGVDLWSRSVA
jgi:hypothetical protein